MAALIICITNIPQEGVIQLVIFLKVECWGGITVHHTFVWSNQYTVDVFIWKSFSLNQIVGFHFGYHSNRIYHIITVLTGNERLCMGVVLSYTVYE